VDRVKTLAFLFWKKDGETDAVFESRLCGTLAILLSPAKYFERRKKQNQAAELREPDHSPGFPRKERAQNSDKPKDNYGEGTSFVKVIFIMDSVQVFSPC
jgi:hypothetical protein